MAMNKEELMERLQDLWDTGQYTYVCGRNVREIIGEVIDLIEQPTADVVEVRHGEWINKEYHPWGDKYICSVCGFTVPQKYKNCPECISRMDGGAE